MFKHPSFQTLISDKKRDADKRVKTLEREAEAQRVKTLEREAEAHNLQTQTSTDAGKYFFL